MVEMQVTLERFGIGLKYNYIKYPINSYPVLHFEEDF